MPDIYTPAQVAECRERAERATDGPWIWNHGSMETDFATVFAVKDEPEHAYPENQTGVLWGDNLHADTCFIAHARTDIPALCATVEALRAAVENHGTFRWMDMTPNDDLPRRILSAYLDYSDWTDNTAGLEPTNPLILAMNQHREQRNALIEAALAALEARHADE